VWICKVCGKTITGRQAKGNMKQHVETHIEGIQHSCTTCGKTYKNRNSLHTHISMKHRFVSRAFFCLLEFKVREGYQQFDKKHAIPCKLNWVIDGFLQNCLKIRFLLLFLSFQYVVPLRDSLDQVGKKKFLMSTIQVDNA